MLANTAADDAALGAFALADNLGSIVARVLLLPFEETAFALFAKAAARERELDRGQDSHARAGRTEAAPAKQSFDA